MRVQARLLHAARLRQRRHDDLLDLLAAGLRRAPRAARRREGLRRVPRARTRRPTHGSAGRGPAAGLPEAPAGGAAQALRRARSAARAARPDKPRRALSDPLLPLARLLADVVGHATTRTGTAGTTAGTTTTTMTTTAAASATPEPGRAAGLRALWLTETYPPSRGGMAQSCDRIVRGLRRRGVTVDVLHFTARPRGRPWAIETQAGGRYLVLPDRERSRARAQPGLERARCRSADARRHPRRRVRRLAPDRRRARCWPPGSASRW